MVIKPGDVLVVRVDTDDASRDQVDAIYKALRAEVPEAVRVLVVAADQLAVIRG